MCGVIIYFQSATVGRVTTDTLMTISPRPRCPLSSSRMVHMYQGETNNNLFSFHRKHTIYRKFTMQQDKIQKMYYCPLYTFLHLTLAQKYIFLLPCKNCCDFDLNRVFGRKFQAIGYRSQFWRYTHGDIHLTGRTSLGVGRGILLNF